MNGFAREINYLLMSMLLALGIIGCTAVYWSVVRADDMFEREDNPRLVIEAQQIMRGDIVDRRDAVLATTSTDTEGFAVRAYPAPAMYSAVGYYSFRYGAGGAEAAFDTVLSGAALQPGAAELLLNQPRSGNDIRLTFDLGLQQAIVEAMNNRTGAVLVMAVPSGEILAMVSQPTYDPNILDDTWDALIEAPGEPFFNRALQGKYQPGGMMQNPLVIAALVRGQLLSANFDGADNPVTEIEGLTLSCIAEPPASELSLRQAYIFGCPRPFLQLGAVIGRTDFNATLSVLQLESPPMLEGYVPERPQGINQTLITRGNLIANALGQGEVNVSPLAITLLTASVINEGNAPRPFTLLETRPPNGEWTPVVVPRNTVPYSTAATARRIADLMRAAVTEGNATAVQIEGTEVGGHTALAFAGDSTQVWFTGFGVFNNSQNVAVTVVLEDEATASEAAVIGRVAISAAQSAKQLRPTD